MFLTAFSILLLVQISTSGLDINATTNQHVGIIFWSLSIALNIILTTLIVGRLAWVGRSIRKALNTLDIQEQIESSDISTRRDSDPSETEKGRPTGRGKRTGGYVPSYAKFTSTYTSVGAMLIESAALYTSFTTAFLVTYIVSEPGSYVLIAEVGVLAAFSPTLIAYRVFQGKGWSSETNELSASIIFSKFSSQMATEPNVNLNATDSGWTSQPAGTIGTIGSAPTMSGSYGTVN